MSCLTCVSNRPPDLGLIIVTESEQLLPPSFIELRPVAAEEKKTIIRVSEAAATYLGALCPASARSTLTNERFEVIKQLIFAKSDKRLHVGTCTRQAMVVQELAAALFNVQLHLALVYRENGENIRLVSPVPWETSLHAKGVPWRFHSFCFTRDDSGITIVDMVLKETFKVRDWQEWMNTMWDPLACPTKLFDQIDANELLQQLQEEELIENRAPYQYLIFNWFSRIYGLAPPLRDHYKDALPSRSISARALPAPIPGKDATRVNQWEPYSKFLSLMICAALSGLAFFVLTDKKAVPNMQC